MLENTLYINLSNRPDRNSHVLSELQKIGILNPTRMDATKANDGAIGCTLSHIKCLEFAKTNNWSCVFICEDDITFTNPKLLVENLEKINQNPEIQWDVLLIGGNNCPPYEKVAEYCIRTRNVQTCLGYVVKQHYYDKLIHNFRQGLQLLLRNPANRREYAVDMYWKRLQHHDGWYMVIPATVVQYSNYSNIENKIVNYDHLMLDIEKKWLFH